MFLLRVNDCITRVNNLDCSAVTKRKVLEAFHASQPFAHIIVRRRRSANWSSQNSQNLTRTPPNFQNNCKVARWVHTARLAAGCHGLSLESGVYISRISEGSLASKDSSLVVGDRVLRVLLYSYLYFDISLYMVCYFCRLITFRWMD